MRRYFRQIVSLVLFAALVTAADPVIGQSSVITLAFPWGARAAGLGETFTGVADDESAMFYNPAGLGQAPLTKKWQHYQIGTTAGIKSLAAHPEQKEIWALTDDNMLYKFNGSNWSSNALQIVDSGQTVEDIARIFLPAGDNDAIVRAASIIRNNNNIHKSERKKIGQLFEKAGIDKVQADSLSTFIALRPSYEHNRTDVYAHLLSSFDDNVAQRLARQSVDILDNALPLWAEFYTLKVPYSVAFNSEINTITIDANSRLWVATNIGLWRFGFEWGQYGEEDGLKADTINSLAITGDNELLIGTQQGAYTFKDGLFSAITSDAQTLTIPVRTVTKTTNEVYLGTSNGVLQVSDAGVVSIDSSNGLTSNNVHSVFIDSQGDLWVGGEGGVSHYDGEKWSRFKFAGSTVYQITEENKNHLWFATNNGAVEYIYNPKKKLVEWKSHHTKNNLKSNQVRDILYHNFDSWVATSEGVSQYRHGEIRASFYFENLLPNLHIDNMWHAAVAGVIPVKEFGTIGISVNQLFFGDIADYNNDGTITDSSAAFEIVVGLTYALGVTEKSSVGLTAKYFYSRLQKDSAEVSSIAFDAGVLRQNAFNQNMSFGISMLNMGPAVAYAESTDKDPIPFTIRAGMSYIPIDKGSYRLRFALDLDREIIYVDSATGEPAHFIRAIYKDLLSDPRETWLDELAKITVHIGTEFTFQNFITGRLGYMHDDAGHRKELNIGIGVHVGRVIGDFGIIMALGDNDVRQNQIRFSITYAQ